MNIVFDVNVLVSALIAKGKPRELWFKAVRKEFNLVSSREIVSELTSVVSREKIQRYVHDRDLIDFLEALNATAKFVYIKSTVYVAKEDPDDDVVLATACDGKADYVVSGDKHLPKLKKFRGIKIIRVDQALHMFRHES